MLDEMRGLALAVMLCATTATASVKCLCESRVWKIAPFARWYSMTTSRWPNTHSARKRVTGS